MTIHLIVALIKKMLLYKISKYFPKPSERFVKVVLDLSNYAIKSDLEGATGINTFSSKIRFS